RRGRKPVQSVWIGFEDVALTSCVTDAAINEGLQMIDVVRSKEIAHRPHELPCETRGAVSRNENCNFTSTGVERHPTRQAAPYNPGLSLFFDSPLAQSSTFETSWSGARCPSGRLEVFLLAKHGQAALKPCVAD